MSREMLTVAHFVSPYLFRTGSWIHAQLLNAHAHRPIVLTQALEEPERFPFEPICNVNRKLNAPGRLRSRLLHLAGRFDPARYVPILREQGAALIHAHMGWEGARAVRVAQAAGLPLVTSFYGRDAGLLPRYPWWRWRYRHLFRHGAAYVVEGPHLGGMLERLGCPPDRVHVIHLGIDLGRIPYRSRKPGEQGEVEILVSASLRAKKGVRAAVDAFAVIAGQHPAARLRILGDGPERSRVQEAIRRHRLGGRVTLEGYVSYNDHLAALDRAHIFLAPSRTAPDGDSEGGAPVALIESQAAGLPIVSTLHADIPEVVEDGIAGLLSPEFDDRALARNLQWLLEHPEHWPAMGRSGRERMEKEFCAAIQAERVSELYQSLARRR